ncbi:MAG TPA: type II secretion system protein [Thermoanaerobaculia bacterium]|jgi:prepilin-type N-terminal cleavage/methylation domain-containing protein
MRRQRGFSLIEVLAGILILTIVVTTSLVAFTARKKRLQQAHETILVWQALANEAEHQRRRSFQSLVPDGPPETFHEEPVDILEPLSPYATIVTVTSVSPFLKHVTMTVRWGGGKKSARLIVVRADTGVPGCELW